MYRIQTLNKISVTGLEVFPRSDYEIASEMTNPDAILVRSADMHSLELPASLKAVSRAGIGIDNVPVSACTDKGVVVFNTPGANANAVKEMVLCALFLSSRQVCQSVQWARGLVGKGDQVPTLVEKEKNRFAGPEIQGKTLGVIGLGAIGVMVANAAIGLGMNAIGYDPFISVESAWGMSRDVRRAESLEYLLRNSDYITIHVPLNDNTRALLSTDRIGLIKQGARLLNFSRGGLVRNEDVLAALKSGRLSWYVTDFPEEELLSDERVIPIPHLGASTPESEENCAVMAAQQIKTFLETGNIRNSVNFPDCGMDLSGCSRIVIANRNVPNMVGQITTILAREKINIADMINKHKQNVAYNIIDIDDVVTEDLLQKLRAIEGVVMVRKVC